MQCTLAWTLSQPVETLVVEQCRNTARCDFVPVATLGGTILQVTLGDLRPQHSYCWRVQPWQGSQAGAVSNIVCQ